MQLDATRFPLVFLREHDHAHSADAAEAELERLLDRNERFVLLTEHLPGDDHDADESHEARKQRALFFKRNKARLKQLCAGMVIISGDRPIPAPARLAVQTMGKVLGFGSAFVPEERNALEAADRLLSR